MEYEKRLLQNSYWLSRVLYIKFLGFVSLVAFSVAFLQNSALIGPNGLTPASELMNLKKQNVKDFQDYLQPPTLFWFIPITDMNLSLVALTGMLLSLIIMIRGQSNFIIFFIMWSLYLSIVNIGNVWYTFGWENQLIEQLFLAAIVVPIFSFQKYPKWTPVPWIAIIANIWLLFRIMIGAGLIKLRTDKCWWDLTCMNYHYLTQPVPNPFSSLFHASPESFHEFETITNHVVEILLPWLLLIPYRPFRIGGALAQIAFQMVIVCSGNFSFLNWLTVVPAILCLDDLFLRRFFSQEDVVAAIEAEIKYRRMSRSAGLLTVCKEDLQKPLRLFENELKAAKIEELVEELKRRGLYVNVKFVDTAVVNVGQNRLPVATPLVALSDKDKNVLGTKIKEEMTEESSLSSSLCVKKLSWAKLSIVARRISSILLALFLSWRSIPVIRNLFSPHQIMNTSYDPFRLMNAYGLFGYMTKERNEVIFQGTLNHDINDVNAIWYDYEFNCKPGNINKRPCLISPYHYRIDWLLWFAAIQDYQQAPWIVNVAYKLLKGDSVGRQLLASQPAGDPFLNMEIHENQVKLSNLSCAFSNTHQINQCFMNNNTVSGNTISSSSSSFPTLNTILPTFVRVQLYQYEYSNTPFLAALTHSFNHEIQLMNHFYNDFIALLQDVPPRIRSIKLNHVDPLLATIYQQMKPHLDVIHEQIDPVWLQIKEQLDPVMKSIQTTTIPIHESIQIQSKPILLSIKEQANASFVLLKMTTSKYFTSTQQNIYHFFDNTPLLASLLSTVKSSIDNSSALKIQQDVAAGWEVGTWWKRRLVRNYMPAISTRDRNVLAFLKAHHMMNTVTEQKLNAEIDEMESKAGLQKERMAAIEAEKKAAAAVDAEKKAVAAVEAEKKAAAIEAEKKAAAIEAEKKAAAVETEKKAAAVEAEKKAAAVEAEKKAAAVEAEKKAAAVEAEKKAAAVEAEKKAAAVEAEKKAAAVEAEKKAAAVEAEKNAAAVEAEKKTAAVEAEKEAAANDEAKSPEWMETMNE